MNIERDNARSIVEGIVAEIEARISPLSPDRAVLLPLRDQLRRVEEAVLAECARGVPKKLLTRIRETLGPEILEVLDSGKLGPLFKNHQKLAGIHTKLGMLIELYRCAKQEAQLRTEEVQRLQAVQKEIVESQIEQVREVEQLEGHWRRQQMLTALVLVPFEEAIKKILDFLEAVQLEVFLFDDDKFLATELKTDGKTFVYHKEEEKPPAPEAVRELKLKEVQESILDMPMAVEGRQIGHFRILRQTAGDFDKEQWKRDVIWVSPVVARVIEFHRDRLLARKVYIDDLTQLYNKRKLNEQMGKLFHQFKKGQKKLFLAMLDIDKFKNINDTFGHGVGDEILKQTAFLIKEGVPNAYRFGGEEFCAVFYGFDKKTTLENMEKVRRRIESNLFLASGKEYRITISSGVAEFETFMNSVMDAVDRADQALYISKEDGRNRCTYYDDVKHRLTSDQAHLRQEVLQLKEKLKDLSVLEQENKRLREQIGLRTK